MSASCVHQLCASSGLDTPRAVAETGRPGAGFGSPRGGASARVVPVSIHFPASGTGTRSLDGIRRPRLARNIIFEVTQTAFRGSTVPRNLRASPFRQTGGPHNTPHRTLHDAINTIASMSSPGVHLGSVHA